MYHDSNIKHHSEIIIFILMNCFVCPASVLFFLLFLHTNTPSTDAFNKLIFFCDMESKTEKNNMRC